MMDVEAPGNAADASGNPEVAWWCKILTRVVASIAGVGELNGHDSMSHLTYDSELAFTIIRDLL